jgi:hypothetical protein
MWGTFSEERIGLSFTIAAGPPQRSHSQVGVPRDTGSHFTLSDLILPQPGGKGHRIYIPQEQGGPVIPPVTGFPFRRLLWLAGLRRWYFNPPPHGAPGFTGRRDLVFIRCYATNIGLPSNNRFRFQGNVVNNTCIWESAVFAPIYIQRFRRHFLWLPYHSIRWFWHSCDQHHLLREYHTTRRTLLFGSTFLFVSVHNLYYITFCWVSLSLYVYIYIYIYIHIYIYTWINFSFN